MPQRGVYPTKALTTATELLLKARRAGDFGLSIPQAAMDLPALMTYKRTTVEQLVTGVEQLLKARRVTVIRGEARLVKPDRLLVEDSQGAPSEVSAPRVILAPGSRAAVPPIEGDSLPGVVTSTGALEINTFPPASQSWEVVLSGWSSPAFTKRWEARSPSWR